MILPNLPVSDVNRATAFYTALGFVVNPQFTNEQAAAIVVSDDIVLMLLSPDFAAEHSVALPSNTPNVSLALTESGRDAVDARIDKALAAGATLRGETTDLGFMYSRGISDPDGHFWDFLWMDPGAVEAYEA